MDRNVLKSVTPIAYGHGEFFVEFIHQANKKGLKILELPCIQPPDQDNMSKTAPNLYKFAKIGFFYFA